MQHYANQVSVLVREHKERQPFSTLHMHLITSTETRWLPCSAQSFAQPGEGEYRVKEIRHECITLAF